MNNIILSLQLTDEQYEKLIVEISELRLSSVNKKITPQHLNNFFHSIREEGKVIKAYISKEQGQQMFHELFLFKETIKDRVKFNFLYNLSITLYKALNGLPVQ